jgi:hypothetical protein
MSVAIVTCLSQRTYASRDIIERNEIKAGNIKYVIERYKSGDRTIKATALQGEAFVAPRNQICLKGEALAVTHLFFDGERRNAGSPAANVCIPRSITHLHSIEKYPISSVTFEPESQLTTLTWFVFSRANFSSICVPASVKALRSSCLSNCPNLRSVTFEQGSQLETIERNVFSHDIRLKAIRIPAKVTVLERGCFRECTKLELVEFEKDSELVCIEAMAFSLCSSLKSIAIPDSVETLQYGCFEWSGLEEVTFGKNSRLQNLGQAFRMNDYLLKIAIPSNVRKLEDSCFKNCYSLEQVTFAADSKLESIGSDTFTECFNLATITISAGVKRVPINCFNKCGLQSVIFESNEPIVIKRQAFYNCPNLQSITFKGQGLITIDSGAFRFCPNLTEINTSADIKVNEFEEDRDFFSIIHHGKELIFEK